MPAPAGILRPSALAIARGLSFAQAFQSGATPWLLRGAVPGAFGVSATIGAMRGGVGMVGSGNAWYSASGNTYSVSATQGTILSYTTADHASNAATARMLFFCGQNVFPAGPSPQLLKFSDGNCYFGWVNGSDKRVVFSGTGIYSAGDTFTAGTTWDSSGQVAYIKGVQRGSNASTGYAATSGWNFDVGTLRGSGWDWVQSASGAIYYTLIFDRAFTASEMAAAEADPWWWVETSIPRVGAGTAYPLDAQPVGYKYTPGAVGLEYRRTLAAEGVIYHYAPADVALNYYPAATGDTHDGFVRRTRRQRAMDAAERQRRSEAAQEAVALRLSLEAAMGLAAEAVEDAPQPVADVVETATREAARYVPMLARGPAPEVLQAANEAIVALRSAIAAADRARMLAEDDEDVLMLLRAL